MVEEYQGPLEVGQTFHPYSTVISISTRNQRLEYISTLSDVIVAVIALINQWTIVSGVLYQAIWSRFDGNPPDT